MEVGLRVVRGPDWKWQDQDGGEGYAGTVVELGKPGSTTSPAKTVIVQWDSGTRTNYRIGYQGAYDLRVLDNASLGMRHPNIVCDTCQQQAIQGIRWKCLKCFDFDLCHTCYMANKHDLNHPFLRFDTANSAGFRVGKRQVATRLPAMGIFSGAKVMRGPDWDWGNQDGGEENIGKVLDIRGWDHESGRSVANVVWSKSGATNIYRMGHKGKVDLKYVVPAEGPLFYIDHLLVLGQHQETIQNQAASVTCGLRIGERVRVELEEDVLRALQEGHGGWNPRMAEYIGKVGTVHRITDKGDVRIQYEGCTNRWTFHSGALTRVCHFSVGDMVRIELNQERVKELQRDHGEWTDGMEVTLGKTGRVLKVYGDGDLRVAVEQCTWTFNPSLCTLLTSDTDDNTLRRQDHSRADRSHSLSGLLEKLGTSSTGPEQLVTDAAHGKIETIKEILNKFPDRVDQRCASKTSLQVAAHQGHIEIVKLLLDHSADIEGEDDDGDRPLHYAVFGNKSDMMELLLSKDCCVNAVNKVGCSPLHVAVNKQLPHCAQLLLQHKADVNLQDLFGDTVLHDAIGKESKAILEMLIDVPSLDLTISNKRGFNALHHAALKGNSHACSLCLKRARQLVDSKKEDGFGALHLAALNGHIGVAELLIEDGRADLNIQNNRQQTPLMLAVSQGQHTIAQMLASKGANMNAQDEDGDTCLHLSFMRSGSLSDSDIQLAVRLVEHGAKCDLRNKQNKVPLDLLTHPVHVNTLENAAQEAKKKLNLRECMICTELSHCVVFQPCGHSIACAVCSIRMKKCLMCQIVIECKMDKSSSTIDMSSSNEDKKLHELQQKMHEMEDSINCNICLERPRKIVFMCGHSACTACAQSLKICHMCRKSISKRINLF